MRYTLIPARLNSKRFPYKPICMLNDKPIIQHTWENSLGITPETIIITPNDLIADMCLGFNAKVILDDYQAKNGTDRVIRAAKSLPDCTSIINVQSEWPAINQSHIIEAIDICESYDHPCVASLFYKGDADLSIHKVKVVLNIKKEALYFSRLGIPFRAKTFCYHVGVYVFNEAFIHYYDKLQEINWLGSEDLEQLQWLGNKIPIHMIETTPTYGIDCLEDLDALHIGNS